MKKKIRVITVDDSKIMLELLNKVLSSEPDIEVIGSAQDPYEARDLIKSLNPDVITLDIMLPKMDGITFLKNIMRLRPMPVVMVSSLTKEKQPIALTALELGAIDYIAKPSSQSEDELSNFSYRLVQIIRAAASANVYLRATTETCRNELVQVRDIFTNHEDLRSVVVAIGASTGGVEALETILSTFPKAFPPVLVVLHIRKEFISSFAQRIAKLCNLVVKEAVEGDALSPGCVYIAPSEHHMTMKNTIEGYVVELNDNPPVNGHKPSIDVLFQSIAVVVGYNSVGVLLTGMGKDGAEGLKAIKYSGGATIAQDEESSVVWGMPGAAVKLDAVDYVMSLSEIPQKILNCLDSKFQSKKANKDI